MLPPEKQTALENVFLAGIFPLSPHAKLNLRLEIVGQRDDGYHLLRMINVLTTLHDELVVRFSRELGVTCQVTWRTGHPPLEQLTDEQNLVCKAFTLFWLRAFSCDPPFGFAAELHKFIPSGSGLGGGSSDAAAVLRLLQSLCAQAGCPVEEDELLKIALELGADVPFFCIGTTALVEGIGERITYLEKLNLRGVSFILVVPPVPVPTPEAYRLYKSLAGAGPKLPKVPLADILDQEVSEIICNDLQGVVSDHFPLVAESLRVLTRHLSSGVGMTGSGAAVFGIVPPGRAGGVSQLEEQIRQELPPNFLVSRLAVL